MRFNKIINEMDDIPIKNYNPPSNDGDAEGSEEDYTNYEPPIRFNPDRYKLKAGMIIKDTERALDMAVKKTLTKYANYLPTVYGWEMNGTKKYPGKKIAYIVYYTTDVSKLEDYDKNKLINKIRKYEEDHDNKGKEKQKQYDEPLSTDVVSNVKRALEILSPENKQNLTTYINGHIKVLQKRDKKYGTLKNV